MPKNPKTPKTNNCDTGRPSKGSKDQGQGQNRGRGQNRSQNRAHNNALNHNLTNLTINHAINQGGSHGINHSFNHLAQHPVQAQTTVKGCCCKRSQCIKNYCDCYQSMVICSQFCRCLGCRNTEVRKAVDSSAPAKNSKREKAAAMSAKAAAAAAKAGIHVPVKQIAGPGPGISGKPFGLPPGQIPAAIPVTLNKKPQQVQLATGGRDAIPVTRLHFNGAASVRAIKASVQPQSVAMVNPAKIERESPNFFSQPVNAALLECVLVQATEAEQMGFNDVQVGQLILMEFMRGLKAIYEATCEHNQQHNNAEING